MKSLCIVSLLLVACVSLKAQYNLVPNSSFEIFDTCAGGNIARAIPWQNPLYYTTPDYFNACHPTGPWRVPANYTGYQFARTGVAYADFATYTHNTINPSQSAYREYIEVELIDSLKSGVDYCIQFYVSACDSNEYISNDMGIYFSPTFISDTCPIGNACNLPYMPQFENPASNNLDNDTGWTLVSGTYTAQGGERFIIIGNFKDEANTVATQVGWGIGGALIYAVYYIDDVLITPCDSLTGFENMPSRNELNIYPNPSNGTYTIKNDAIENIEVFDVLGKQVYNQTTAGDSKITIDISTQPKGIYILKAFWKKSFTQFKLIKNQ